MTIYFAIGLTGGAAGNLDSINGNKLVDGDTAFATDSGTMYNYVLDDDSATAEASPDVIAPDTNAGDKRWILQNLFEVDTTNVSNPPTDAELDAAFGVPSTVGAGFLRLINDAGAGSNFYAVASDGTNWWQVALTKAT